MGERVGVWRGGWWVGKWSNGGVNRSQISARHLNILFNGCQKTETRANRQSGPDFFSFSMIWLFLGLSKEKKSKHSYKERFKSTILFHPKKNHYAMGDIFWNAGAQKTCQLIVRLLNHSLLASNCTNHKLAADRLGTIREACHMHENY